MSLIPTILTIEQLSHEGNQLFKNGKYNLSTIVYEKLLNLRIEENKQQNSPIKNEKVVFLTMNNLAMSYIQEKKYTEAESLLTVLYNKRMIVFGKDHIDTLQTIFDLSSLLTFHFDQDDRALILIVEYLSIIQSKEASDSNKQANQVLVALTNLGTIYYRQNKLEKASEIFESIIEKRKTIQLQNQQSVSLSTLSLETITTTASSSATSKVSDINIHALIHATVSLADIHYKLKNYPEAEKGYEAEINYKKSLLGSDHKDTINSLIKYSNFLQKTKNYSSSLTTNLDMIKIKLSLHNNDVEHDDVYPLLSTIGQLYFIQSDYKNTISYYLQYTSILQRKFPFSYQQLKGYQNCMINTGNAYYQLKQYRKAVSIFEDIKYTFQTKNNTTEYNIETTENLANMNTLACLYSVLNIKASETELLYISCLKGRYKLLGETHPNTINTLNNLCHFYKKSHNYIQAEKSFITLSDLLSRVNGGQHTDTIAALTDLAYIWKRLSKYDYAEPLYNDILTFYTTRDGPESGTTLKAMAYLAIVCYYQCKYDIAKSLLQGCYDTQKKKLGDEHPEVRVRELISV